MHSLLRMFLIVGRKVRQKIGKLKNSFSGNKQYYSIQLAFLFPFTNSNAGLDFYDPNQHTEVSIERARRAYRPLPDTISIISNKIPLPSNSVDKIFLLLATHEIRNQEERETFFKECKRILRAQGSIIVLEHLRDFPNFLVYTIGFFHFHSHRTWLNTFRTAGLILRAEKKVTPFLLVLQYF